MAAQPVMLRMSLRSSTRLLVAPRGNTQYLLKAQVQQNLIRKRAFADTSKPAESTQNSILSSDPAFLPGSKSSALPPNTPLPPGPVNTAPGSSATPATPSSTPVIPSEKVPLTPPPPTEVDLSKPIAKLSPGTTSTTSSASSPPPPPPATPSPKPKPRRRGLRFLLYLLLTSGVAYGGAVVYALNSDNFHDFFTEYVPLGEESVLYFEERSFHKRFPNARHTQVNRSPTPTKADENRITIPSKSGLSWRVAEEGTPSGSDLTQKGRHMSALEANKLKADVQQNPSDATVPNKAAVVEKVKKEEPPSKPAQETEKKAEPAKLEVKLPEKKAEPMLQPSSVTPSPKADPRPPAITPVTQLSPLEIANADEPLVQELVKIVNDIITVINSDSPEASSRYSGPVTKAKESLAGVGAKILALKEAEKLAAEERISAAHKQFDDGAKELLRRVEAAQNEEKVKYQEEFETEREKISRNYAEKLKTEVDRSQQLTEQRLKNELTEQAIEMKRKFISDIKSLVEAERNGRLSKLSDLSTNVDDLQKLTSEWNGVIDTNLATQKLQVAVDAVKSSLSRSVAGDDRPKPFVREMAALKLVSNGDPVVDAAIASINPTAYQRGIPSPAQLMDRFRRVASEVRKASLLPEDAGVASHAASFVLSKVMFKKQGQPQGDDVESVLTRTETLLEEGDLDGATREMNTLKGWAGVLSKDWLSDCRKVLEVKQALEVIETEARLQCLRVE